MLSRETFYCPPAIRREARTLPAALYNTTRILLYHGGQGVLFVPIRSMLFQAVIGSEEILFVDAAVSRSLVVLVWQSFRLRERPGLDSPVPFEVSYHDPEALGIMPRLQGEFTRAVNATQQKLRGAEPAPGRVIELIRKRPPQ